MAASNEEWIQRIIIMRHGDRLDQTDSLWPLRSKTPWNPPLAKEGFVRAWTAGRRLRGIGCPINRAIVSPFLRCIQTANETVKCLCAVVDKEPDVFNFETSEGVRINPSEVKVSIEYGLCEMLNREAMGSCPTPQEGQKWFPDTNILENEFSDLCIDSDYKRLYNELPKWGETVEESRNRYASTIQYIGDTNPRDNILLVTHGEAVGVSVSYFEPGTVVYEVNYCGYTILERRVSVNPEGQIVPDLFKVASDNVKCGVSWTP
ncbi:hypothetical protein LUZ60_014408 [Juncus effusus]|nr:hypothetical protein LUZ60_014408 [Juncus effusus]